MSISSPPLPRGAPHLRRSPSPQPPPLRCALRQAQILEMTHRRDASCPEKSSVVPTCSHRVCGRWGIPKLTIFLLSSRIPDLKLGSQIWQFSCCLPGFHSIHISQRPCSRRFANQVSRIENQFSGALLYGCWTGWIRRRLSCLQVYQSCGAISDLLAPPPHRRSVCSMHQGQTPRLSSFSRA